jgi:hypothetical protein
LRSAGRVIRQPVVVVNGSLVITGEFRVGSGVVEHVHAVGRGCLEGEARIVLLQGERGGSGDPPAGDASRGADEVGEVEILGAVIRLPSAASQDHVEVRVNGSCSIIEVERLHHAPQEEKSSGSSKSNNAH